MISKLPLFLFSIFLSTQASAHTGSHSELVFSNIVQHVLSNPLHSGIVITLVVALSFVLTKKYGN